MGRAHVTAYTTYIVKQKQKFLGLKKNRILLTQIYKNSIILKPSKGSREVPQIFGPYRFSCIDIYWIQTDRQAKYI